MERSLSSLPISSPHLTSSPHSLLPCVLVRPEELGWSVLSCAGSSLAKLYLDRLAFCPIGYANFTPLFLHGVREKEKRAQTRNISLQPFQVHSQTKKGVRPLIIEGSAVFFFFFFKWSVLGHFYYTGSQLGRDESSATNIIPRRVVSLFKQQLRLKGQEESHVAQDWGTGGDWGGGSSRKAINIHK